MIDRILCDGTDRDMWKHARESVIGASDAARLSKLGSVPLYLAAKLKRDIFTGNVFTESGYRWEPMILGWGGYEHNVALFHAPDETGFAATPDGIKVNAADTSISLAEVKVKHVLLSKRTKGPTLAEWRQLAWQFRVIPEAEHIDWLWGDIDKTGDGEDLIDDEPQFIRVYPDDPKIVQLQEHLEPIATDLLSRLRAALAFERELESV
ncbi:hypothetical protein [Agromyces lapidis]|uniref:YqaJ viral recombinase domain-containing protein n=1 Tax=Agromyces lapidis TaxID=279574 RepID=A0ABV5SQY4_9MICO|nr:hypothetical protein [Agromyces lapidis]